MSSPAESPQRIVRIGQGALGRDHGVRRAVLAFSHDFLPRSPPPLARNPAHMSEHRHGVVPCAGARTYVRCAQSARVVLTLEGFWR